MDIRIRQATDDDLSDVAAVLREAARWVEHLDGSIMWVEDELADRHIGAEIAGGLFFLAEHAGKVIGTIRFQLQDPLFWPDVDMSDSAVVHRLAVSRAYAGQGVAVALLRWSVEHARSLGRQYLRLDCDADRARLRELYETFGFHLHSYRHVGAYYVARYELPLAD